MIGTISLIPLHQLKDHQIISLSYISSDRNVMSYIGSGKPWDYEHVTKLIEDSRNDVIEIPDPSHRQYLHWGIVLNENDRLIGYLGLHPTERLEAPGSQVRIFLDPSYQGKHYAKFAVQRLQSIPYLWKRILWSFTFNPVAMKLFGSIWTHGPNIDYPKRGYASYFYWYIHGCSKCHSELCYLRRLKMYPEIESDNYYLGNIEFPKYSYKQLPIETIPIDLTNTNQLYQKNLNFAIVGGSGIDQQQLIQLLHSHKYDELSDKIYELKYDSHTGKSTKHAVKDYTKGDHPIIDYICVEQEPTVKGGVCVIRFMKWIYDVQSSLRNILDDKSHLSITNKSQMYNNIKTLYPQLIKNEIVPETWITDLENQLKSIEVSDKNPIIVKPVGDSACSGVGIQIFTDVNKAINKIKSHNEPELQHSEYTYEVSRYISDVMTFEGKKFHLRTYLLIFPRFINDNNKSGEFRVYNKNSKVGGQSNKNQKADMIEWELWDDCKILTAKEKYILNGDYSNKNIHDTHAESTSRDLFFKSDAHIICEDLTNNAPNISDFTRKVFDQMNTICQSLVDIVKDKIRLFPETTDGFEVFGIDFLIRKGNDCRVVLVEANDRVGMSRVPHLENVSKEEQQIVYADFSARYYQWVFDKAINPYFTNQPTKMKSIKV